MKKNLLLGFILLLSAFVDAQVIVEQPKIGMTTAQNVKIEKIVLSDTATVLCFNIKLAPGEWISIPKRTYILPFGSKDTLFIRSADGIPLNKQYTMPAPGEVSYKLIFPRLNSSVNKIDYGEVEGTWFIFDIQLKPGEVKSVVPTKLIGNWFRSDNAEWGLSLLDSMVIYKSQVWKYKSYEGKDRLGIINLYNGNKNIALYIKQKGETLSAGETASKLTDYAKIPDKSAIKEDKGVLQKPVFKNDTAIFCGLINKFSPRFPQRTFNIYVRDLITGGLPKPCLVQISNDGYFNVRIPLYHPQMMLIRFPSFDNIIFIEPGKTLFLFIDDNPMFMGDNARVNYDLIRMRNIGSHHYNQVLENIIDFTPEQYKLKCQELLRRDLSQIDELEKTIPLSSRSLQLKRMSCNYECSSVLIQYSLRFLLSYKQKNKIKDPYFQMPERRPGKDYYDFLTDSFVNNEVAVITSDYFSLLKNLSFLDLIRYNMPRHLFTPAELLLRPGVQLNEDERDLLKRVNELDSPEVRKMNEDFQKTSSEAAEFSKKYEDKFKILKEKNGSNPVLLRQEEYLTSQGFQLTDQEKKMLKAYNEYFDNPLIKKRGDFMKENGQRIIELYNDHREVINDAYREENIPNKNNILKTLFGIEPGLATDLMNSQDICQKIVFEGGHYTDEKLNTIVKNINNPFIAGFVRNVNNEARNKTASLDKTHTGAVVKTVSVKREVTKTAGEKIFDSIMDNYKGKIVFVDFWGTWCAPCRAGIAEMKPLKEELANENIVFVYITDQSSPKSTYNSMVPDIKGEHYRLTKDEWNIVASEFNIGGVPRYMVVGKDGKIIYSNLAYMGNPVLKNMLMKLVEK